MGTKDGAALFAMYIQSRTFCYRTTSAESFIQLLPVAMAREPCLLGALCASRFTRSHVHACMYIYTFGTLLHLRCIKWPFGWWNMDPHHRRGCCYAAIGLPLLKWIWGVLHAHKQLLKPLSKLLALAPTCSHAISCMHACMFHAWSRPSWHW